MKAGGGDLQHAKRLPPSQNPQKVFKKARDGCETGGLSLRNLNVPEEMMPPQAGAVDCQNQETDQQRIKHRKQQIAYGKNTLGYEHYLKVVPIARRHCEHPCTPDPYEKVSKRQFDTKVKLWRRQLHNWDAQQPSIHDNPVNHSCSCQSVHTLAEEAGVIGGASFASLLRSALGEDILDDDDDAHGANNPLRMSNENKGSELGLDSSSHACKGYVQVRDNASPLQQSTYQVGSGTRSFPSSASRQRRLHELPNEAALEARLVSTRGHGGRTSATAHAALTSIFDDCDDEAVLLR